MFFEFCLGLRTADFLFSIGRVASNTVHRDILSLGLLRSLWREPRSCLGRVFNSKLGHSATLGSKCMVGMQPLLKLKTRPKARPVS